jgi:hypothetical protein
MRCWCLTYVGREGFCARYTSPMPPAPSCSVIS